MLVYDEETGYRIPLTYLPIPSVRRGCGRDSDLATKDSQTGKHAVSLRDPNFNGHYDDEGHWVRTKFCFVWCGDRCDCGPPNDLYYDESKDKRLQKDDTKE